MNQELATKLKTYAYELELLSLVMQSTDSPAIWADCSHAMGEILEQAGDRLDQLDQKQLGFVESLDGRYSTRHCLTRNQLVEMGVKLQTMSRLIAIAMLF